MSQARAWIDLLTACWSEVLALAAWKPTRSALFLSSPASFGVMNRCAVTAPGAWFLQPSAIRCSLVEGLHVVLLLCPTGQRSSIFSAMRLACSMAHRGRVCAPCRAIDNHSPGHMMSVPSPSGSTWVWNFPSKETHSRSFPLPRIKQRSSTNWREQNTRHGSSSTMRFCIARSTQSTACKSASTKVQSISSGTWKSKTQGTEASTTSGLPSALLSG